MFGVVEAVECCGSAKSTLDCELYFVERCLEHVVDDDIAVEQYAHEYLGILALGLGRSTLMIFLIPRAGGVGSSGSTVPTMMCGFMSL